MEKPLSIAIKELKEKLVNDLNDSKLPITISLGVLQEIYEIGKQKEQEIEMAYFEELKKEEREVDE